MYAIFTYIGVVWGVTRKLALASWSCPASFRSPPLASSYVAFGLHIQQHPSSGTGAEHGRSLGHTPDFRSRAKDGYDLVWGGLILSTNTGPVWSGVGKDHIKLNPGHRIVHSCPFDASQMRPKLTSPGQSAGASGEFFHVPTEVEEP